MNWIFDTHYNGYEDERFLKDLEEFRGFNSKFEELNQYLDSDNSVLDKFSKYIDTMTDYLLLHKAYWYTYLQLTINSNDSATAKMLETMQKISNNNVEVLKVIESKVVKLDNVVEVVKNDPRLSIYNYRLEELIKAQEYVLAPSVEKVISKMSENGSVLWKKYKDQIISNMKVEIDGKKYPLTEALNFAYSSDAELRKKAYYAELESYKGNEEGIAAALNGIKGEAITISELRGYESVLDMTVKSSRITHKILDSLIASIEKHLPYFRKYFLAKAKKLGYDKMRWYDMYAPVIEDSSSVDYEEGKKIILDSFGAFSTEMKDFANKAFNNGWIDVYPTEGKTGGAFCSSNYGVKESRILLNYGDSVSDVITLAHELGHGFHSDRLWTEEALNTSYPMVLAETASNFCEIVTKKYLKDNGDEAFKLAVLELEISDLAQVVVDIYSRFVFERSVIEKRKEGVLSVEEIKNLMLDAQKKAYGEGFDEDYLHPYMWTWKTHYYNATLNFYNYPYAFGALFSKGLYEIYQNEGESFVEKYNDILRATGKMSVVDVAKLANIDVESVEFWDLAFKSIVEDIELFEKLV